MTEPYLVWALLVGVAIGGGLVWFVLGRLPRRADDVGPEERLLEASWISDVIESRGGSAPSLLVEQVLELHEQYVAGPPIEISPEQRAHLRSELYDREAAEAEAQAEAEAEAQAEADAEAQAEADATDARPEEVSETRP